MFLKKPIYGAGSENINLISRMPRNTDKIIIQEYHPGIKGSFSMICCKKKKIVLSCNKQIHKIKKNKISQQGNINGGLENYRSEIEKLAEKIVKNFPGLFGFVGVDIVKIKGTWHVIEINPRFTSSIISLEDTYGSDSIKNLTDFYIYEKIKNIKIKLKKKK